MTLESLDRVKRLTNRNKYDQFFRYPISFLRSSKMLAYLALLLVLVYVSVYVQ